MSKRLVALLLCSLVALSRSSGEPTATTLAAETTSAASGDGLRDEEEVKPKELPVDLLSTDKILLDPKIILARSVRDTYHWARGQSYDGQLYERQGFGAANERRPFGIKSYEYYMTRRPVTPARAWRRNNDLQRLAATPKRFKIYPVFSG